MKILFIPGASPATIFSLGPLASAARTAGHQVLMGTTEETTNAATGIGLPALAITPLTLRDFVYKDLAGRPVALPTGGPVAEDRFTGEWAARMAKAGLPTLRELSLSWRPDLVVGGTMCYAAPVLAAELGVPYVRQTWDANEFADVDRGAASELGLSALPEPDLFLDITPPSLRFPGAPAMHPIRWMPANSQRALRPWMYTPPQGRPRVCVTAGSRISGGDRAEVGDFRRFGYEFLLRLATELSHMDVDLVVAAPDDLAPALHLALGDVHAGWVPLDVVAPTCAAVVHTGGGVTGMTALSAGVPQLLLPLAPAFLAPARRLAERGAAIVLEPEEFARTGVAKACDALLTDPSHREAAAELAKEIAILPPPARIVEMLELL